MKTSYLNWASFEIQMYRNTGISKRNCRIHFQRNCRNNSQSNSWKNTEQKTWDNPTGIAKLTWPVPQTTYDALGFTSKSSSSEPPSSGITDNNATDNNMATALQQFRLGISCQSMSAKFQEKWPTKFTRNCGKNL